MALVKISTWLALLAFGASAALAQEHPPLGHGITLLVSGGLHAGNQADDFHTALVGAGLDYSVCNEPGHTCIGEFPADEGPLLGLSFAYAWTPHWEVRALVNGLAQSPWDFGGRVNPDLDFELREDEAMRYGLILSRRILSAYVRLGAGPTIIHTHITSRDREYGETWEEPHTRLGFALDSGFTWPRYTRVLLDLSVQYWYGGDVDYGPYPVRDINGTVVTTIPESTYSLNRFWFGVGFGIRI